MWQSRGRLAVGLAIGSALLAACASRERQESSPAPNTAIVHNSIRIGLITTTFFVVDSVDGAKVHEKMDFKRQVQLAAGKHELAITYYTDALWGSRDSRETCSVEIEAEPNGSYRVEGEAVHGEWRAQLVDDRTGREFPCLFPDEAGQGAEAVENKQTEGRALPAVGGGAPGSKPSAGGVAEVTPKSSTAGGETVAASAVPRPSRRGSFCSRGSYRVGHWEGPATFVLERSDRVRLIGVQPDAMGGVALTADPLRVVGKCVRFDYEPTNLIDGHRDRDGRLLAYVYLEDGTFVNLELIRGGWVRASDDRHRYLAQFLAAQSEARKAQVGVWSQAAVGAGDP